MVSGWMMVTDDCFDGDGDMEILVMFIVMLMVWYHRYETRLGAMMMMMMKTCHQFN